MRGVGRDDQRLASRPGQAGGRGRSERRLADATLAREQHDPHGRRLLAHGLQCLHPALEPLERGVDDHLLGLAAEHADHRDVEVDGEGVRHRRRVARCRRARTSRPAPSGSAP